MRRIRIYQDTELAPGDELALDARATHHVVTVLRRSQGDRLVLFDGRDHEAEAEVVAAERRRGCRVRIGEVRQIERESPLAIELVQALSRPEKMELVVQKAVELGVAALRPTMMQHCETHLAARAEKRLARWREIVIAASEQCGRTRLMAVHAPVALAELAPDADCRWRLEPDARNPAAAAKPVNARLALAIGPEGGLGPEDRAVLDTLGFSPVGLGPRVLRTETAALAAVSVAQCLYGDFDDAERRPA